MNRTCLKLMAFLICLPGLAGCLFVRHHTKIDREKEMQQQVVFENVQAQRVFESRAANPVARAVDGKTNVVAVPFLLWSSTHRMKSEAAYYNDQIRVCDKDGDRQISEAEALSYNPNYGQEEQVTSTEGSGTSIHETVELKPVPKSDVRQASSQRSKTNR